MVAGQKNFHRMFAHVSPVFVSLSLSLALLCTSSLAPLSWGAETTRHSNADVPGGTKRSAASAQFAKAEEQRAALNSKASEKRMLADYKLVVATYRHVALITARAPEVPDALVALGELYTEMGDRFGRNYYQFAVDSYQFLAREYPGSRYTQDAVLRTAKLQRDQLNEPGLAMKTYADFLKRFPRSSRKREAQESMAELALLQNSGSSVDNQSAGNQGSSTRDTRNQSTAVKSAPVKISEGWPQQPVTVTDDAEMAPASGTGRGAHTVSGGMSRADAETIPRLRRIRTSASGDATRVIIDLEDSVQYSSARIANPDRIFFDLHAARLTPELARNNIKTEGELLTGIRVAQNHSGVVRVVLDINGVKDYTASLTHNPTQLLIDLYGGNARAPVQTAKAKRAAPRAEEDGNGDVNRPSPSESAANNNDVSEPARGNNPANREIGVPRTSAIVASTGGDTSDAPVRNTLPTAKTARSKSVTAGKGSGKPEFMQPVAAPQPTRDGGSTLTRVLGLKIGRIVIDAGHGGHDTGTIGPTGLMEKDLCLDVALRLGRIIQQRLPGADVVYTRSDDTFIPLEERTAIANQARADLFISIHANSSQDHGARGVETYYLNLKGSADAMEVAARENASSQQGIHDLEDLVKQIARTEKIDESKELAQDVQGSLTLRMQKAAKTVKNRGVRKAPFVVLIGADMPSILTEISFLSNPADEVLLKKPEHRQRVAEGIYQGVASYLQSLNSVTVNLPPKGPSGKAGGSSSDRPVEQSRNQN
jgi:N-acetylmuramoyl-L-alanine amidase